MAASSARSASRTTARSTASTTAASSRRPSGRAASTAYVDWSVRLGQDVVLEPAVVLRGETSVGDGSAIGPGATIEDSTIGAACRVWLSVVERSTVADGVTVGPFSHLRPGS